MTEAKSEKQKEREMEKQEISFYGRSQGLCVCYVGLVESINMTANLARNTQEITKYYSLFVNTMAIIGRNFAANILKNTTDRLIFYFPKTSDPANKSAFKDVIECGLTMTSARCAVNKKANEEGLLAPINYRISADYGILERARSKSSQTDDLFGPTMNICAKINSLAPLNSMVIGEDLHRMIKSLALDKEHKMDYLFEKYEEYSIEGSKYSYPIYCVISKYASKPDHKLDLLRKREQQSQQPLGYKVNEEKYHGNILLVDDNNDILFTYELALHSEGFKVDAFSDPLLALKRFAEQESSHFELVILDIRMPELNGLQLYYRLKAINPNVKVLFTSALDAADELMSVLPGVKYDDIIRKPINLEYFVSKAKSMIENE